MRKSTTEEFITKAKKVHGDKYSYELVDYVNNKTKVKIVCPIHGVFEQIANGHLNGFGCSLCAGNIKLTTEEFIVKARKVHSDRYSYELVDYVNARTKVKIVCPIHGVFEQTSINHFKGKGCPVCFGTIKSTTDGFITKAKKVHGDKYTYELVEYKNNCTKVVITCPEHGVFEQTPNNHLRGKGCSGCCGGIKYTIEQFITKAKEIHGDKYSYDLVGYVNACTKVKITCLEHGVFEQVPGNHLSGQGCPLCANSISRQEIEFTDYIKSLYDGSVITNTRGVIPPYELDVYLPDLAIAFEYNGTYWHNEGVTKPIGYHDMKTDRCKAIDITLHHIWEDEWMNNREECKESVKELICM